MRARRRGIATLARLAGCVAVAAACAYNGVYNARRADHDGERALLAGDDTAAARSFALASAAAETLLARSPNSRWNDEALALAGRGLAFTGDCGHALSRLDVARVRARDLAIRESAAVAAGWCLMRGARYSEALALLEPLQRSRDDDIAALATRWSAQALLAQGNATGAARILARDDPGGADWTLARDAFDRGLVARAESLLVRRATANDLRPQLPTLLRDLWLHGDTAAALRVTRAAVASRGNAELRAVARVTMAELLLGANRDMEARALLAPVPRLSADSILVARSRDAMLASAVRGAASFDEILRATREDASARGRTSSAILLARTLAGRDSASGAGNFLAAEVVRDSLAAPRAARSMFLALPVGSPLAAKAWLAAARLAGDSAPEYVRTVRARWPDSPYLRAFDGHDPDTLAVAADTLLRRTWDEAILVYADSLNARRAASASSIPARRP
ncbi:MAG TPA: hypothetical protein VF761_11520 [Gemmatimonadaceae bacterium]